MKNIDEALREIDQITNDACGGKLTEAECKKRLDDFRAVYGEDLINGNTLGSIKNEPASKEKLRKLRIIQAQGGTSEETFIEMARTGRKLRQKKVTCTIAAIVAVAAAVAVIVTIISALKK